ncbi:MAG: hypothetical protein WD969_13570, partial [Paracoccaceae bacterium]
APAGGRPIIFRMLEINVSFSCPAADAVLTDTGPCGRTHQQTSTLLARRLLPLPTAFAMS